MRPFVLVVLGFVALGCGGNVPAKHDHIAGNTALDAASGADGLTAHDVDEASDVIDGRAPDVPVDFHAELDLIHAEVFDNHETGPDVVAPVCLQPPIQGDFLSQEAAIEFSDQGVNQYELPAFEIAAQALLEDPAVLFISTYLNEEQAYLVKSAAGWFKFNRSFGPNGPQFEMLDSEGEDPFGCTSAAGFNTYALELDAGSNPYDTQYPDLGYTEDDPRLSFIAAADHCYPFPLLRISQLFDAPNAPDFHYGLTPSGVGSGGSHGALDVLQARSPLIISGTGIKKGYDDTTTAMTVDIPPTVLYLMGATAQPGGFRHGVEHGATYLKWQDGNVISSMLEDECTQPYKYAFILLFDGLQSNELIHLYEEGESGFDLPAFTDIMSDGTIFRNGAIVGFPTVSVPGHLTVGTGMLNGHHRFINNGFYYRVDDLLLSPGDIIAQADEYAAEPEKAIELFEYVMNPLGETIFEAAHRHFGDDVFAASINELTLIGADHNLVDMARALAPGDRTDYFELADSLATPQILGLLDEHEESGKQMLFFVSFYTTDHAGELGGPHSDELRKTLVKLDSNLQFFLQKLEDQGIRDESIIVITADHGMETQDVAQSGNWQAKLAATGLKYIDPDGFGCVYLPAMRVECVLESDAAFSDHHLSVAVVSDDTGLPVENATVTTSTGADCFEWETCVATTDQTGNVLLITDGTALPPSSVHVEHDAFNGATANCQ